MTTIEMFPFRRFLGAILTGGFIDTLNRRHGSQVGGDSNRNVIHHKWVEYVRIYIDLDEDGLHHLGIQMLLLFQLLDNWGR
jgi:hypothetical protein